MSNNKKNISGRIDWHSGFEGGLRLSFRKYAGTLVIEREHLLSKEPLRVDFLVIRKNSDSVIDNAVGRGFLKHNIIEFKNPNDELNIDTIWKVIGYAGLYKSQGKTFNEIKSDEITISIFRARKPKKLFKMLINDGKIISNESKGIYLISGIVDMALRIVVMSELTDDELMAMRIINRNANPKEIETFLRTASRYSEPEDRRNSDAVLQISARVNQELFSGLRGDEEMCEALREIMADELKEAEMRGQENGRTEGKTMGLYDSVRQLMKNMKWTATQALDALGINGAEREAIMKNLNV